MDLFNEEAVAPVWVLNPGQQSASDWFFDFITNTQHEFRKALLEGWAGTGKTFTINRIIERVRVVYPDIKFGMTAPTHKAVRQLKKHSELKESLDFGTIHSYLGLKEKQVPDPKDHRKMIIVYEPDFNSTRELRIDSIDVLIVDESSMLDAKLYEHIEDYARSRKDLKVIFMGDGLQIPPVRGKNEEYVSAHADAIPFVAAQRQSRKIAHIVLSDIVRQGADNPIIAYATEIRKQYKNPTIMCKPVGNDTEGVVVLPRDIKVLREVFSQYFDTDEFRKDADYVKIVAWRNDTVNYFNNEIRLLINKVETLPRIIVGEKLVLNKPILRKDKIILANNEELEVLETQLVSVPVKYKLIDRNSMMGTAKGDGVEEPGVKVCSQEFKCYRSKVVTVDGKLFMIDILHEDDVAEFETLRKTLETKAKSQKDMYDRKEMWKQFFALDKPFANVGYNYCITAHKAQGSTYDYCISMEWDIDQNWTIEERNRIKYVAATRARHKLYIVK